MTSVYTECDILKLKNELDTALWWTHCGPIGINWILSGFWSVDGRREGSQQCNYAYRKRKDTKIICFVFPPQVPRAAVPTEK